MPRLVRPLIQPNLPNTYRVAPMVSAGTYVSAHAKASGWGIGELVITETFNLLGYGSTNVAEGSFGSLRPPTALDTFVYALALDRDTDRLNLWLGAAGNEQTAAGDLSVIVFPGDFGAVAVNWEAGDSRYISSAGGNAALRAYLESYLGARIPIQFETS